MGEIWSFGENGVLSYDTRRHVSVTHNFIWPTRFPNAQNCQHIFDASHRMLHNSLEVSRLHFKRLNKNKIHTDCQRWLILIKKALVCKLRNCSEGGCNTFCVTVNNSGSLGVISLWVLNFSVCLSATDIVMCNMLTRKLQINTFENIRLHLLADTVAYRG